jgi:hypothetical protein
MRYGQTNRMVVENLFFSSSKVTTRAFERKIRNHRSHDLALQWY